MIIPISDDAMGQFLEFLQIIDHQAIEEITLILQGRFINNHLCPFALDALHDSLDAALAVPKKLKNHDSFSKSLRNGWNG